MAYMLVRHTVKDYEAWKSVFDSKRDLRKRNGEISYQILRDEKSSNDLVALFAWDNLENAREFSNSAEMREAMAEAGVIAKPEFSFLEESAEGEL